MEATHFIEVFKIGNDPICENNYCLDIDRKEEILNSFPNTTVTIAVWRIKLTDVPLKKRMLDRENKRLWRLFMEQPIQLMSPIL